MATPTTSDIQTLDGRMECDVAILGGGIAGLSVALSLPAALRIVLVTKGVLGESNTRYAQGGLAAAVGLDDSPELHLRDTLAAGDGLVDEAATRALVNDAREAVAWLIERGTRFDAAGAFDHEHDTTEKTAKTAMPVASQNDLATGYDLTREAAHSRRRVLHARDATGAEIERSLVEAVRGRPNTTILDSTLALDLIVEDGACRGVVLACNGRRIVVRTAAGVVLANGGAGQLWLRTSNPAGATADGLALAWRAGAALADLAFVQFHPTVLAAPGDSGEPFLISEAVRGEGAYLRNASGERFMPRYSPDAELAPRDVVARAIHSEMLASATPYAYLDLRHLDAAEVRARFPTIGDRCRRADLDLTRDLIPISPAAHYFMGGVAVDTWARTTVPNLYAVGEVSCTGVHGANRLASNSLLEGLVFGRRAARALVGDAEVGATWPRQPVLPGAWLSQPEIVPVASDLGVPVAVEMRARLRLIMWERAALRRNADGLAQANKELRELAHGGPFDPETASMLFAAQAIVVSALAREESRGGHFRDDYPARDPALDGCHTLLTASPIVGDGSVQRERVLAHA